MPKIRVKKNTLSYDRLFNGLPAKSGVCTSSIGSILDHEQSSFSYFNHEIIHSSEGYNNKSNYFDDNFTNIFVSQSIIPTIGITKSAFDLYENKILHEPCVFNYTVDTADLITATPSKISYNNILKENYLKTETISYKEGYQKNNDTKRNEINIAFDQSSLDVNLSFSLDSNTSTEKTIIDSSGNEVIKFPAFNGNTAILEEPSPGKFFDYIGDISKNYFNSFQDFIEAPICFNGLTMSSNSADNNYESNFLTLPIQDFGFPYSEKFKGQDRHLIKMNKHITRPFVVEKIRLRANISNYSVSETNNTPCLNFINFFIINQKGKLNYDNIISTNENISYIQNFSVSGGVPSGNLTNFTTSNSSHFYNSPKYSSNIKSSSTATVNSNSFVTEESQPVFGAETIPLQQRDLISTITIANYSEPLNTGNTFFDKEKITNNVDLFIDNTNESKINSTDYNSECIYENKSIEILSDVKSFYPNKCLNRFSAFGIYPKKENSNRTNTLVRSGRSVANEGLNNTSETIWQDGDHFNKTITHREKNSVNNGYILDPNDKIYVGISLSTQFNISGSQMLGRDYTSISMSDNKPLLIDLIGYYLEDGKEKRINSKEVKQYKNVKKIGYGLREVVDNNGLDSIHLAKGAYYDIFKNNALAGTNNSANGLFKFSSLDKVTFGGFLSFPNDNNNLLQNEEYFEDNVGVNQPVSHYYKTSNFGQPVDKINFNRNSLTGNLDSKIKSYPLNKKFKKGFYIEKVAGTIKGKINFDFTGIHEYTGKNFLTEKIFDSKKILEWVHVTANEKIELAILNVNVTDENDKKINFVFQIPIPTDDQTLLKRAYSVGGLGSENTGGVTEEYTNDGVFVYTKTFPSSYSYSFLNANYNTSLAIAEYNFIDGGRILNEINSLISEMRDGFNAGFAAAGININSSINQNSQKEFITIDFEINNKGKLNNASLQAGRGGSNISYENFVVEEGDIINSYNINKNAYYSNSDVIFEDNY